MDKKEYGIVAFSLGLISVLLLILFTWADDLASSVYFNVSANEIQLISGPGTAAAVVMFLWVRWHSRCSGTNLCIRHGEHPVKGTTKKVCHKHHTIGIHQKVHSVHHLEGRLGWGESHDPNNHLLEEQASPTGLTPKIGK